MTLQFEIKSLLTRILWRKDLYQTPLFSRTITCIIPRRNIPAKICCKRKITPTLSHMHKKFSREIFWFLIYPALSFGCWFLENDYLLVFYLFIYLFFCSDNFHTNFSGILFMCHFHPCLSHVPSFCYVHFLLFYILFYSLKVFHASFNFFFFILKSEWQQVYSDLQDASNYSRSTRLCWTWLTGVVKSLFT